MRNHYYLTAFAEEALDLTGTAAFWEGALRAAVGRDVFSISC